MTAPERVPCSSQRSEWRYKVGQTDATLPSSWILQDLASKQNTALNFLENLEGGGAIGLLFFPLSMARTPMPAK